MKELIQAGKRVRDAQEKLLAGGDRKPLDRAASAQREATKSWCEPPSTWPTGAGWARARPSKRRSDKRFGPRRPTTRWRSSSQPGVSCASRKRWGCSVSMFPRQRRRETPAPKKKRKSADKGDEAASRTEAAERRRAENLERKRLTALEAARKAEQRARRAAEAAERATAKERTTAERAIKRLEKAESDEESARAKLEEALAEVERLDQGRRAVGAGSAGRVHHHGLDCWPRDPGYTGPAALIRSRGPAAGWAAGPGDVDDRDAGSGDRLLGQQHEVSVAVAVGIHALDVENAAAGRPAVGESGWAGGRLECLRGRAGGRRLRFAGACSAPLPSLRRSRSAVRL